MPELSKVINRMARELDDGGIAYTCEQPLSHFTTMGVGGPAEILVQPSTVDEMVLAIERARDLGLPVKVLGAGSNLLIHDAGVRGVVLHTMRLKSFVFGEDGRIEAGAGAHFPTLVKAAARRGLRGIEGGVGIPGSIGGVLTMNAGAYAFSISPMVEQVIVVSPNQGRITLDRGQIEFRYRSSSFGENLVITHVRLRLASDEPEAIKRDMDEHMRHRKQTQPVGVKSAGCIFKNPEGESAGRLLDRLGLKGFSVGSARISDVHANFIVHDGKASASDVAALIEAVQELVLKKTSITLEHEVMVWH